MRSHRAKGRSSSSLGVRANMFVERQMLEVLGIVLVALAFVAFLVLVGRSF